MAIPFPDNISVGVGNPLDSRYLSNLNTPYASEAAVISAITESQRYVGLTVNIDNEEWWWKDSVIDGDLVSKSLGGTSNLSGATNGLSLFSGNTYVGLGGDLTQSTIICAQGNTFQVGDAGPGAALSMNQGTVSTVIWSNSGACNSSFTILPENVRTFTLSPLGYIDNMQSVTGSTTYVSTIVCALGGDSSEICQTSNAVSICSSDSGFAGAQYGGDYEDNFVARSLATAQYVTGQTSGGITEALNGVCKSGQNVCLGGDVTALAQICICDNNQIIIGSPIYSNYLRITSGYTQNKSDLGTYSGNFFSCPSQMEMCVGNSVGGINSYMQVDSSAGRTTMSAGSSSGSTLLRLCSNNTASIIGCLSSGFAGFEYCADFSSNYSNRSLVDKEYVTDAVISGITGSSNIIGVCNPTESVYSATTINDFVGISGGTEVFLPITNVCIGQRISVVDIKGDALINPVTICSTFYPILDDTVATINTNYGSITFVFNGIFWSTTAFIN